MTAIQASMSFVKKYPIVLCGFSLLFMPTVHKLVIYFTPLLISTAIFFLAMLSSTSSDPRRSSKLKYDDSEMDADWLLEDQHKKELAAAMEKNEKMLPQLSARLDHLARNASSNALLFHDCQDGDMSMIEDSEIDTYMEMMRRQEPDPDIDTVDDEIRLRSYRQAEAVGDLCEPDPDLNGESKSLNEPDPDLDEERKSLSEPDPDLNEEKKSLNEPDPDLNGENKSLNEPDPDLDEERKSLNEPDPDLNEEKRSLNEPDPDLNGENMSLNEPDPDLNGESMTNSEPDPDLVIESNIQVESNSDNSSDSHTILAIALERTLSCTLDHNKEDPQLQCRRPRHHRKHSLQPLEAAA